METVEPYFTSLLTVPDLTRMFGVTPMTIHNWRKDRGLPAVVIPGYARPTIRFQLPAVIAWARREGVSIHRMHASRDTVAAA